jgi:hypothetical protein
MLVASAAVMAGFVLLAAPAGAQTVPQVVLSETIRDAPGSVHLAATLTVDPALVGGTCEVEVIGENNQSVHPNSDVLIASGNEVIAADVERAAGSVTTPAGTLELDDTITVRVRLGSDGVFSGGLLSVNFACTPPPPPPTTAPVVPAGGTPTIVPAGESQTATTAPTGAVAAESGTLPRTGTGVPVGAIVAGAASVLVGVGLLARARRPAPGRRTG